MRKTDLDVMEMELAQLRELILERKDPVAGRAIAQRIQARLREQCRMSATLEWFIALSYEQAARWLEAAEHIERALHADPLEPTYLCLRRVVYARMRAALVAMPLEEPPPPSAGIVALHTKLTDADEANVDCHLHLARWYARQEQWDDMRQLLEAVVLLHPTCKPAWEALTLFARERRNAPLKRRAQAKVDELTPPVGGSASKALS